jgi:glyoxylase-like metal-dependent hydrolase (beta-lactamase superfamily II)
MESSYRFQIGDFECLVVNDGTYIGNAEMLFANAPEEQLLAALQANDLKPDYLPSTLSCLLVKTPANIVLIDTGFGTGGKNGGQLLSILRAEGLRPEDIDSVILTHAHADHIGGCVDEEGRVTFSEATHYMWQDEWDYWTSESEQLNVSQWAAKTARVKLPPLARQLKLIENEIEIVPGIRAFAAPGHTTGHMAVEIESSGEFLIDIIDTALHPIQVAYPEWYSLLDQFPEQTVATRHAVYQRAIERNALVLAFHFFPFPSLGYIARQNGKFKWQSLKGR